MNCAVKGCKNYYRKTKKLGKKVQYFSFPKENDMALKWLEVCKTQDTKGRICSVHFEPSCFTKSLQQQLLGYSPRKGRKLRNDAMPTLHLFHKLQVEKTPLLDNSEKTTVALLHVDDVPNPMTNTSMSTVNKSEEPINASTHINDSTDVIDAVVSIDVVDVSSTSIEDTSKNTTVAVIGSPAATDLCSPNNDIDYMNPTFLD